MLVGLGVPAFALLGGVTLLSGSGARVLGWPALYLWVFLCFPLTTVCLAVSWRVFDRRHYREPESESGSGPELESGPGPELEPGPEPGPEPGSGGGLGYGQVPEPRRKPGGAS
ncbi:DUF3311 domain-containing protein [Streptomyces iconiensis]|uniref:DUF3311 domain-containing protein n=1 Tax=Streptomyces iconiensis TaxID=1384038 RepID=A0ABT7A580_9ACTN|nr:DUF3311 domain-containing protein [Streptomyces iconiensis]MDJ1136507.1 DUF3311 domain-containing protein [Streptomyces iconiensis]